ncbi:MAG: hypothetical protein ABT940_10780, partial [Alphaproteobacteria bacterium]
SSQIFRPGSCRHRATENRAVFQKETDSWRGNFCRPLPFCPAETTCFSGFGSSIGSRFVPGLARAAERPEAESGAISGQANQVGNRLNERGAHEKLNDAFLWLYQPETITTR